MKFKIVDVVLVAVIVASLALIGLKLNDRFSAKNGTPGEVASQDLTKGFKATHSQLSVDQTTADSRRQPLIERVNIIDDSQWSQMKTQLGDRRVSESVGCASEAPEASSISFRQSDARKLIRENRLRTAWARGRFHCYKRGTQLLLLEEGKVPTDPALQIQGIAEVEDIVSGPVAALPEAFFTALGVGREAFVKLDTPTPEGTSAFQFLRLKPIRPIENLPSLPPMQFPGIRVVPRESVFGFLKANPNAIVIDTRSALEFRRGGMPGAINIPFGLPGRSNRFDWKITIAELRQATFAIEKLGDFRSRKIIVYGRNRADGGGIWAIMELQRQGFSDLVWVADGFFGQ